ncbi:MAG: hypothetical protein BVN34_02055 [Proteobacteria bacterium ST_bin12]|nr:MAG: hypothetical protein BVN34_02055 [Proteobacteria bacterium ST_bin12]
MPRLKAINSISKIETKINLTPNAKEILARNAKELKLNQNQIVENMIINFNAHKDIIKNSNYIIEKEALLTQMIKRIEENINFNKLVLEKIDIQNEKLQTFDNSLKSLESKFTVSLDYFVNKFGEYRKKSRELINNNNKTIKEQLADMDEKVKLFMEENKIKPLLNIFGKK